MIDRRTALGMLLSAPGLARAQSEPWPSRAVTVISPVQAGSAGDTSLRLVTQKLSENLKVGFAVENLAGAAGMIGVDRLSRARPDGYTIGGISDSTLTYVPIIQGRTGFNALDTLAPVTLLATSTWVLVAHPSAGFKTVQELVAASKARRGTINYASAGVGGSHHLVMEMFKSVTGTDLLHVPYRGAAAALQDVQAGQVQLMFSALSVAIGAIREGKLVPLGVALPRRTPLLPQVPTVAEQGLEGFTFSTWTGLLVPRGTPAPIIDRLNAEAARALGDPAVSERLLALGATPQPGTPKELEDLIQSTTAKMGKVIREANIKGQ